MLFFSALANKSTGTFEGIARLILNQIMRYSGNIIHFVADKWLAPSIKDTEHIDRDAVSSTYKISGPSQKRPTDSGPKKL